MPSGASRRPLHCVVSMLIRHWHSLSSARRSSGSHYDHCRGLPLPPTQDAWTWFWQDWRNHELKAHRAFLYEIVHPVRIAVPKPDGGLYEGEPLLERMPLEKEVGLYVDYDRALQTFVAPVELIEPHVALMRLSTLTYLCATADAVRRAIFHDDEFFRFNEFSRLAHRFCTTMTYQQQWPDIRAGVAAVSRRHAKFLDDLDFALNGVRDMFRELQDGHTPDTSSILKDEA